MKTILFKTIIIAFFVGTAVSCSDEDENRFRPGSTHEKPNPTEPEGGLDYSKLTAEPSPSVDERRGFHCIESQSGCKYECQSDLAA